MFKIEYGEGNRFVLVPDARLFSAPLADYPGDPSISISRSPVDPIAVEIERLCPNVWISVGSGQTAFNFYAPTGNGDAIVLGMYQSGDVWTDVAGLGPERATRLASELAKLGISLDASPNRKWAFWMTSKAKANLALVNPTAVAEAVQKAINIRSAPIE